MWKLVGGVDIDVDVVSSISKAGALIGVGKWAFKLRGDDDHGSKMDNVRFQYNILVARIAEELSSLDKPKRNVMLRLSSTEPNSELVLVIGMGGCVLQGRSLTSLNWNSYVDEDGFEEIFLCL